ncbi:MAG TPA: hypothetical protein PLO67_12185 [Saprospiraceae bacterium]|nr:hypothetical protein [Saprospiraceae bacterium]
MNHVIAKSRSRISPFIILNVICFFVIGKDNFKGTGLVSILIINLFLIIYYSVNKNIYEVDFEDMFIIIKYKQFWRKKSMQVFYQHLSFTYKKALVGRGITDNVIDLFDHENQVARIHPSNSRFGYDDMDKIIALMEEKGVIRKG